MKRILPSLFFLLLMNTLSGQIRFEPGYLLTNEGERIECLIKNVEWKSNPTKFKYQLREGGETKWGDLESVREFGIGESIKYRRFTVAIDRSSDQQKHLSELREPQFKEETLFLKLLVAGSLDLYYYEEGELRRLFIHQSPVPPEQLVYKRFYTGPEKVGHNHYFRRQLLDKLKCPEIPSTKILSLEYQADDVVELLLDYERCLGTNYTDYHSQRTRPQFFLSLRPGWGQASLEVIDRATNLSRLNYPRSSSLRLGIELEMVLAVNQRRWALLFEPNFRTYRNTTQRFGEEVVVDYQSLELPIGLRHYLFLNSKAKIFVNASGAVDLPIDGIIDYQIQGADLSLSSYLNLLFGVGFDFDHRLRGELRYGTNRNVLSGYDLLLAKYRSFQLILGYTFGLRK
ncbi:MAG: hypothetical protein AAFW73_13240 [Bacteroidota bacterium]